MFRFGFPGERCLRQELRAGGRKQQKAGVGGVEMEKEHEAKKGALLS